MRAGLHFFIPIVVLLWCLMVEELSPGLVGVLGHGDGRWRWWCCSRRCWRSSAAQGDVARGAARAGSGDLWKGLVLGARNMIGIGVACASAGLIVGAITLTGMGLMMTDFVEWSRRATCW